MAKPNRRRFCAMATGPAILLHLFLLLQLSSSDTGNSPDNQAPISDADALLLLKKSFANATALSSWTAGISSPCDPRSRWIGVICLQGAVVDLRLSGYGLSGSIDVDALSGIAMLRAVRFSDNVFSGPIPPFGRLRALKVINLSGNRFSGPIADDLFKGMIRLKKLRLNGNAFEGAIPSSLSSATSLRELLLQDNHFNGTLPPLVLPSLSLFNVSNNDLQGLIPDSYSKFQATSFMGNVHLCGVQLGNKNCDSAAADAGDQDADELYSVFISLAIALLAAAAFGYAAYKKGKKEEFQTLGASDGLNSTHQSSYMEGSVKSLRHPENQRTASSVSQVSKGRSGEDDVEYGADGGVGGEGPSDLIMVNESKGGFGLQDLMKAAAEVIGSGGLGSAYKAVMKNGVVVVVKRMREMNRVGKETFDIEMQRFGKLRHPNVLPPLAYHYRKDEKLLVSEFIPKGSLLYVLHGDRGANHAALDWFTRLKIARGIANGLVYLHTELSSTGVPHGNLKSGNVLLAPDFQPLLVDYGFLPLVNSVQATNTMFAFQSPEFAQEQHLSPKADVYCLGVILLELLTGKFPSVYLSNAKGGTDVVYWATSAIAEGREEEILDPAVVASAKSSVPEMKRLVAVALECIQPDTGRRLDVWEAVARIEEVVAATEREREAVLASAHARDVSGERVDRRTASVGVSSARRMEYGSAYGIM